MIDEPRVARGKNRGQALKAAVDAHAATATGTVCQAPSLSAPASGRCRPRLAKGTRLAHYTILRKVGAGGMGDVFAARDDILHREVALKVMAPRSEAHADRLLDEARMMARVIDERVVTVHSAARAGDLVYLAMELVRGCTLKDWISAAPRSLDDIVRMFVEAGHGLAAAHAAGMIHRDFKPANVLVADDGTVKVSDFGIALAQQGAEDEAPEGTARAGSDLAGTPVFMALEQLQGRAIDARADQYGFAASLFWALFRRYPKPVSGTYAELAAIAAAGPPTAPDDSVPAEVYAVVRRALEPDPDDRFPSLDACLDALVSAMARRTTPRAVAERAIGSVWNEAARRAAVESLHASQRLWAADVASRTCAILDDYAAAWIDARTAECTSSPPAADGAEAPAGDNELAANENVAAAGPSPQLARGLLAFTAVVQALQNPCTDELLAGAVPMALSLPPLSGGARSPLSQVWGPKVAEQYRALTQARAASQAGRLDDAIAAATAVAEATNVPALEAEARLLLASQCHIQTGDATGADAELARTLAAAARAGDDATLAKAWGLRAFVAGYLAERQELAATYAEVAELAAMRTQDVLAKAWVDNDVGAVRFKRGDLDGALTLARRAQSGKRLALGPDHPDIWLSQLNVANVLAQAGEAAAATILGLDALAQIERTLDLAHPTTLANLEAVAGWAIEARDFAAAQTLLLRLHDGLQRHGWHSRHTQAQRASFRRKARFVVDHAPTASVPLLAALRSLPPEVNDAPSAHVGLDREDSSPVISCRRPMGDPRLKGTRNVSQGDTNEHPPCCPTRSLSTRPRVPSGGPLRSGLKPAADLEPQRPVVRRPDLQRRDL